MNVRLFGLLALGAIAACAPSGGPLYFHVTEGQGSPEMGTDCPGLGSDLNAYSGIDGSGTWVVYQGTNGQFLLEGVLQNDLMVGSQTGTGYTFSGTITENTNLGNTTQTVITKYTITMATSGPGFTGTLQTEIGCTSGDGQSCQGVSNDGKDSDCVSSGSITGTQITGVQEEVGQSAQTPTAPAS